MNKFINGCEWINCLSEHLKQSARKDDYCKLVEVTDDWYPNIHENKVFVSCFSIPAFREYPPVYRCFVCGDDDTAVYKDVDITEKESLINFAKSIPDGISREWFLERGFDYY